MADRFVDPIRLTALLAKILAYDGCAADEAQIVAEHLIDASLCGHDSHGVIRILRYHSWLRSGQIRANRALKIISDTGVLLHLDGQFGMGQRLAREATKMGIARAREHGVALIAMRHAGHVGRLGAYAEQACEAGLVSLYFVNVAGSRLVAPFGSAQRCISTAPMAIGVPNPGGNAFILDFATSMVAEGKALVAARGGQPLPDGALVDGQGQRSSEPEDLYGDTLAGPVPDPRMGPGALRTMGEHKGSGLALACELLAGALTGNKTNGSEDAPFGNGMLSVLVDPARLDDNGGLAAEVSAYIDYVRAARPQPGVERVLISGDPERAKRARRLAEGLPLPEVVADEIAALARGIGLETGVFEA